MSTLLHALSFVEVGRPVVQRRTNSESYYGTDFVHWILSSSVSAIIHVGVLALHKTVAVMVGRQEGMR
jgi:hypothetical protein